MNEIEEQNSVNLHNLILLVTQIANENLKYLEEMTYQTMSLEATSRKINELNKKTMQYEDQHLQASLQQEQP